MGALLYGNVKGALRKYKGSFAFDMPINENIYALKGQYSNLSIPNYLLKKDCIIGIKNF